VIDEDPSDDDLARFSGETAYCPHCSAEIWDAAELCPECGEHLGGNTNVRPAIQNWFTRKCVILVIIALLIGMMLMYWH
jgi:hypothetical protein